jgi:methyl-accepting chemotaxis protein
MNKGGKSGAMIDLERRAQQIKEVVRVSAALRADMPPEAICAQVVQTIHSTLGFRAAVVNLIVPGVRHFIIAATAGISDAERQRLINEPPPVDHIVSLMRPNFQISRSYFIGHEHKYILEGAGGIMLFTPTANNAPRGPNAWHPDDVFFVPLFSMRENRLLGLISLDLPEDGKIPSYDTVEIIELLANQAATALDTARMIQDRDLERQALESGLAELMAHLDRMRQRDFSSHVQLRTTALSRVASALNDVSETLGNVLADVRDAGMVVQQQSSDMRNAATQLVTSAQRQAEQIRSVSQVIEHTSEEMRQIVQRAADSSAIAEEAEGVSNEGRQAAELAGEGMNSVREITLQTSKRMKRLGESSQEISHIIQLVSDFASQTHLLALNAAIEAANAGEHGSGFAIVAREIRNLAQNSNDATKEIHVRIKGIQNETNQVAVTIEHATQQVVLLSDLVSRSGAALHAIDAAIQRIISVIATMHQTADEQARAAAAVSETMSNIADITGATWESAEQMRAAMDRLADLAGILQSKIDKFRLGEGLQSDSSAALPLPKTAYPPTTDPRVTAASAAAAPIAPTAPTAPYNPTSGDRWSTSMPRADQQPAPTISAPPLTVPHPPEISANDLAMQATVPMPSLQMPPTPPAAPTVAPSSATADAAGSADIEALLPDTAKMASRMAPAATESGATQLFPASSTPFAPIRLSAIESQDGMTNANGSLANTPAPNEDGTVPIDSASDITDPDVVVPAADAPAHASDDVTEAVIGDMTEGMTNNVPDSMPNSIALDVVAPSSEDADYEVSAPEFTPESLELPETREAETADTAGTLAQESTGDTAASPAGVDVADEATGETEANVE